jgi:hypothetical protein
MIDQIIAYNKKAVRFAASYSETGALEEIS